MDSVDFGALLTLTPEETAQTEQLLPFQDGTYTMSVSWCLHTTSKAGNFMYVMELQVTEGLYKDRSVKYYVALNRNKSFSVKAFYADLDALGVTRQYLTTIPTKDEVAAQITRAGELRVQLKTKQYEGRQVADVVSVKRLRTAL